MKRKSCHSMPYHAMLYQIIPCSAALLRSVKERKLGQASPITNRMTVPSCTGYYLFTDTQHAPIFQSCLLPSPEKPAIFLL